MQKMENHFIVALYSLASFLHSSTLVNIAIAIIYTFVRI